MLRSVERVCGDRKTNAAVSVDLYAVWGVQSFLSSCLDGVKNYTGERGETRATTRQNKIWHPPHVYAVPEKKGEKKRKKEKKKGEEKKKGKGEKGRKKRRKEEEKDLLFTYYLLRYLQCFLALLPGHWLAPTFLSSFPLYRHSKQFRGLRFNAAKRGISTPIVSPSTVM